MNEGLHRATIRESVLGPAARGRRGRQGLLVDLRILHEGLPVYIKKRLLVPGQHAESTQIRYLTCHFLPRFGNP